MPTSPVSEAIQQLRRSALRRDGAGMSDGALLERFIRERDEAALAALVRRHGPMVWGVCRRVLAHHHDAEDAFQATFLVLVRKAASVVPRELLVNWLHGVAYQTARKARATRARRKVREKQVATMPEPTARQQDLEPDLQALLDQEINRLPDKYRAAILLCDVEGKTRREAARQLKLPEGTLSGRLSRGRAMLARRLTRRGLAVSVASLAGVLSASASRAAVPTSVMDSTVQAASLFATGKTAAAVTSGQVIALAEGVLKTMLLTKLKIIPAALLVAAALGLGAGGLIYQTRASQAAYALREPSRHLTVAASEATGKQEQPRARKYDSDAEAARQEKADLRRKINHIREELDDLDRLLNRQDEYRELRRKIEDLEKALQARDELVKGAGGQKKTPEWLRRHRPLRWRLVFDTKDGEDYARQLAGLGAILAIPEQGDGQQLRVFRDLRKRPVTGKIEAPSAIHSINWVDDREADVKGLAKALGLKTSPPYFISFFPEKVEEDLARKERSFAGHDPDAIDETVFKISKNKKGEYEPQVISQRLSQVDKGK